jgi:hypothetical protein
MIKKLFYFGILSIKVMAIHNPNERSNPNNSVPPQATTLDLSSTTNFPAASTAPAPNLLLSPQSQENSIRLADLDTRCIFSIGPYSLPELDYETQKPKCTLCNEILDGISWPRHAVNKNHQRNVKLNEDVYGVAESQFVCLACNDEIDGIKELKDHLNTEEHKENLAFLIKEDQERKQAQNQSSVCLIM